MSEELIEQLKNLNINIKDLNYAIKGFIAKAEALQPDLEYIREIRNAPFPNIKAGDYKTIQEDQKTKTVQKVSKDVILEVDQVKIKENSYKVIRNGMFAHIGKSLIEKVEGNKLYISDFKNAKEWLLDKIDWKPHVALPDF